MADILHDFPISTDTRRVFDAISSPAELDQWWTKRSKGRPETGFEYELWFGPEYDWRARVSRCVPNKEFVLEMTSSDSDWDGTRVGFELESTPTGTQLRFKHTGWPSANDHYRTSSYCWAMYLRVLRRYLEFGETVPYEKRLDI